MIKILRLFAFISLSLSAKEVNLSWDPISFAKNYEIQIDKDKKQLILEKVATVKWSGKLDVGEYQYRVRAVNNFGVLGKWSAYAPFSILEEKKVEVAEKTGEVKNPSLAPYLKGGFGLGKLKYKNAIAGLGSGNSNDAQFMAGEISAEAWLNNLVGFYGSANYKRLNLESSSVDIFDLAVLAKFSLLPQSFQKLFLIPFGGVSYQQIPELSKSSSANSSQVSVTKLSDLSAALGVDVGVYATPAWLIAAHAQFLKSVSVNSIPRGGKFKDGTETRLGFYSEYRLYNSWSFGAGVYNNKLKLNYSEAASTSNNAIDMESLYLLLYAKFLIGN